MSTRIPLLRPVLPAGLVVGVAVAAAGLGWAAPDPPRYTRPVAKAGPYEVQVEKVVLSRNVAVSYRSNARAGARAGARPDARPAGEYRRALQIHVAVQGTNPDAAAGLATFRVGSITVDSGKRVLELPYFGGMLPDSPGQTALVRASLHISALPASVREIRSIDGEVVSYTRSSDLVFDLPAGDGKMPQTVEKEGVKATLRELAVEGTSARLVLTLDGPSTSVLMNVAGDGSYGVSLLDVNGRTASPLGGAFLQTRGSSAEYRLGFQGVLAAPDKVRVRVLHRGGTRNVHPFRLERIPIPAPPAPG